MEDERMVVATSRSVAVSRRERRCGTVPRVYMEQKQGEKARDRPIGRNDDAPCRSEVRARCDRRRAAKSAARHGTPSQWQRSIQKTSKITSVSSSSIPSSTILRSQSPLSTYTNTGGSGKSLNFATQIGNFPSICHEFTMLGDGMCVLIISQQ